MKCEMCGKMLERRHRYCGRCGSAVGGRKMQLVTIDMNCRTCRTTRRLLGSAGEKWRPQYCHRCGGELRYYANIN